MLSKRAASPTSVMPKYISDGHGRDSFILFTTNDRLPPTPHKSATLPSSKIASSKHPVLPKFIPSGNGRDLFCQVHEDKVFPTNTKGLPSRNPDSIPRKREIHVARTTRPPTYHPSGTGRDLHFTSNEAALFTLKSNSFRIGSPSKIPRPRSSPPPRFVATGSGRDSFQNFHGFRPSSPVAEKDQGFAYGSSFLSQSARYRFKSNAASTMPPKLQQLSTERLCKSPAHKTRPLSSTV